MSRRDDVHVLPNFDDGWYVAQSRRILSRHRTQEQAIAAGRRAARRRRVDLVTWNVDGRIRSKDSYGNESPVRDTEH